MPYDQEFLRVTWGFTVLNSLEIAQTNLNLSGPDDPLWSAESAINEIDFDVTGPLLLARMNTLMANANLRWANYSLLNWVRMAAVRVTGLEYEPPLLFEDATPAAGTNAGVVPQASLVLSLRSGLSTGPARFGRMYLPHTQPNLDNPTPFVAGTVTALLATASATFVNGVASDVNAVTTQEAAAMIMTQVTGGISRRVAQVAIGNVIDTQRRRRNQLPETYAVASIP